MYEDFGAPRPFWIHGPRSNFYVIGDKFENCTGGRVALNWGHSAGINIERDTVNNQIHALDRGVFWTKGWMIAKYINITFIGSHLSEAHPLIGLIRFSPPALDHIEVINCTF